MALSLTLIGIVMILAVFRDVFRTLFPYAEKMTASKISPRPFGKCFTDWACAILRCSTQLGL